MINLTLSNEVGMWGIKLFWEQQFSDASMRTVIQVFCLKSPSTYTCCKSNKSWELLIYLFQYDYGLISKCHPHVYYALYKHIII